MVNGYEYKYEMSILYRLYIHINKPIYSLLGKITELPWATVKRWGMLYSLHRCMGVYRCMEVYGCMGTYHRHTY